MVLIPSNLTKLFHSNFGVFSNCFKSGKSCFSYVNTRFLAERNVNIGCRLNLNGIQEQYFLSQTQILTTRILRNGQKEADLGREKIDIYLLLM